MKDNRFEFPVTMYGNLESFNDVTSKRRCRIFYKGGNRNGTYITEEFADHLISTLPYTPVKGIYDNTAEDYTDHGRQRYEGRIYGIVPEDPNFAWESHLDEDGIIREYACVDVLIFSALYKESDKITECAQSMELYRPSIKGSWKYIDGRKYFVFDRASFLGLQILGDDVEPCFEGAGFYTLQDLYTNMEKLIFKLNELSLDNTSDEGGKKMPEIKFKLSDNQKYNMLWSLLNPNCNEEGNYTIDYVICDVYDEYAVTFNVQEQKYERVYYTKDDKSDSLEVTNKEQTYIVDVNENEKNALDALHSMNSNSYEKLDEQFTTLKEENVSLNEKIEEQAASYTALKEEKENVDSALAEANNNYEVAKTTIEDLTSAKNELEEYRLEIETKQKNKIIDKYAERLDENTINGFKEKIEEYSIEELDMKLAYALVNTVPELFTRDDLGLIPKDEPEDGLGKILSKYE